MRVDFQLPALGHVQTTSDNGAVQVGAGVRVGHESGHGVRFDVLAWVDLGFVNGGHGSSWDLSYFYRLRLSGNDRLGLGVDFGGGLSVQNLYWASAGWGSSAPTTPARETIADGTHVGGVLIAALDGRVYGFTFGVDVRAHSVFALQGQAGDAAVQADVSLNTSLGFGFY